MSFLKRIVGRGDEPPAPAPDIPTDGLQAEDHELKLTYRAKSSQGVRMTAGPNALATLPEMLADVSQGRVTVVPPLDSAIHAAAPNLLRPEEAEAWLHATRDQPPDIRHGLIVLASLDAIDPAFETSALAQLSGETDTSGYPAYDAIVGGVVSHWDEQTGDMIVRGVVGWGGRGVRGDTDRAAYRAAGVAVRQHPRQQGRRRHRERRPAAAQVRLGRPGLRPLRLRLGARARVLLPQVRHAHGPGVASAGLRICVHGLRPSGRGDALVHRPGPTGLRAMRRTDAQGALHALHRVQGLRLGQEGPAGQGARVQQGVARGRDRRRDCRQHTVRGREGAGRQRAATTTAAPAVAGEPGAGTGAVHGFPRALRRAPTDHRGRPDRPFEPELMARPGLSIRERLGAIERRARRFPPIRALMTINDAYNASGGGLLASGLAFSALFAVIPGLLLALSVLVLLAVDKDTQQRFIDWIVTQVPPLAKVAAEIVNGVKDTARVGSVIGLVGFVWGASGFYLALENALGRFFPSRRGRDPIMGRVRSIVAVLLVVAGVLAAFGVNVVLSLFVERWGASPCASPLITIGAASLICLACYRLVPVEPPQLRAAAPAALLAGVFIGLLTSLFGLIASWLFGGLLALGALTSVFLALIWFGYVFQALLYGAAFARLRVDGVTGRTDRRRV